MQFYSFVSDFYKHICEGAISLYEVMFFRFCAQCMYKHITLFSLVLVIQLKMEDKGKFLDALITLLS